MSEVVSKFIIFADARTGGTHVMSKLNSHPDIFAVSEPFPHHNLKTHKEQMEWMEEFFSNTRKRRFKALGFRTKIEHQANLPAFVEYINNNDIICFSLQRRNLVKKAISRINAVTLYKETKDYNLKSSDFKLGPQEINPKKLQKEIEVCEKELQRTNDFILNIYDIEVLYYEQILLGEKSFFDSLISKLNLGNAELETRVYKNTSDDLSKSLKNYQAIRKHFDGTKYADDLEEVLID